MARALHLIQELGCGEVTASHFDVSAGASRDGKRFGARISKINAILGIEVPAETVLDILHRLSFEVELQPDGDTMQVIAPRWREDIEIGEPDLAEEIIREYGYSHIVPTFLKNATVTTGGLNPEQQRQAQAKRAIGAQGFYEAITLGFYSEAELDALHIAPDAKGAQRRAHPQPDFVQLDDHAAAACAVAAQRGGRKPQKRQRGRPPVRACERLYPETAAGHRAPPRSGCTSAWRRSARARTSSPSKVRSRRWARGFGIEFGFTRAADVPWLHPGIAAYLTCEGETVGVFGKLANDVTAELKLPKDSRDNQKIFLAEIDWPALMAHRRAARCATPRCRPTRLSRATWPLSPTRRPPCGDIVAEMRRACKQLADVQLFDIYRSEAIGAGKKSMAFTLHFAAQDAPLAPDEVDRFVKKILGNLKYRMGIEMR